MNIPHVYVAALATETNTFSPIPTTRGDFESWFLWQPDDAERPWNMFTEHVRIARQLAQAGKIRLTEGLCAGALPAGPTVRSVYEELRDAILEGLKQARDVDIVILGLHGAMVADGYDDCEGDILEACRRIVGPNKIIGASLDPHCHLSDQMVQASNILIAFKEYPHTDALETAQNVIDLSLRTFHGEIRPTMAVCDPGFVAQFFTTRSPALELVSWMRSAEREGSSLSLSLAHGFASGDVADMRTKALCITDGDPERASELANTLGRLSSAIRETSAANRLAPEDIVRTIRTHTANPGKPIVVADCTDNPGGGAPGDSTHFYNAFEDTLERRVLIGPIWDPVAASFALARGKGAEIDIRIGGKASRLSGQPIDFRGRVVGTKTNAMQRFAGGLWPLGDMVALENENFTLAICSVRNQCFSTDVFDNLEIDWKSFPVIVVKSNHHFYDSFAPHADLVIYGAAPGVAVFDPRHAQYRKVARPLWPLDPLPDLQGGAGG